EHNLAPHLRIVQKALAEDITIRTHGKDAYETAIKTTDFLFGNGSLEFLDGLADTNVLEVFEGVPQFTISKEDLKSGINVVDLLSVNAAVFSSKGEARKMIQGGGVSINKQKVVDSTQLVDTQQLINNKYIIAQRGKKNYFLIIA